MSSFLIKCQSMFRLLSVTRMTLLMLLFITTFCSGMVKKQHTSYSLKTIESEDGDIIECIDIHKQPSFNHPALRNHKVQMTPSYNHKHTKQEQPMGTPPFTKHMNKEDIITTPLTITTTQTWHKSGSCPKGTIPLRVGQNKRNQVENVRKKKPPIHYHHHHELNQNEDDKLLLLHPNRSLAMLHTEGMSYLGAKGDIKVWNPHVEKEDYSTSHVTLAGGPYYDYELVQSGWAVNPALYGDTQTRYFTYWTVDGSNKTGCFDLSCPGFVQTSHEIALGAAIYPISSSTGLPYEITVFIHQDPYTGNWWLQYGDAINIGYWPRELFGVLGQHAETVQWGGEVYSSHLGDRRPHTTTEMGSGDFPEIIFGTSGSVKRMRILGNSLDLTVPDWAYPYADEYKCYDSYYFTDYVPEPEFYYGGPGRCPICP